MGYEVDFMQVGQESKGGDAIALRWGDLRSNDKPNSEQFVAVIDGGYEKSGEDLAELINTYYHTDTIDLVVSTHPDADHIGGLSHILDEFIVKKLWIHKPWEHNKGIASKFQDGRVTDNSISNRLRDLCEAAWKLCQKAKEKNIKIEEPFFCKDTPIQYSCYGGVLKVLGPSQDYYETLLPDFDGTVSQSPAQNTFAKNREMIWGEDAIDDKGETSAKNNSSTILEFRYKGHKILFTADAGIPAFRRASGNVKNIDGELRMIQIPHHGSWRNVSPDVLDNMIGFIDKSNNSNITVTAVVSCAEDHDHKHPNKRVLNAFIHRGCTCYKVRKGNFYYYFGVPIRPEYSMPKACEYAYTKEEE